MSTDIGIIGLPKSGKTTVFNALTGGHADTASRASDALAPHIGMAKVPEPRLRILEKIYGSPKTVYAEAKYLDVSASVKSLAEDKGLAGRLLNQLSTVDTLVCVVRAFKDDSLPHPDGSLDVKRDIGTLSLELVFSDLAIMERRLQRLEDNLKAARQQERQVIEHEKEILLQLKANLETDKPIRDLTLDAAAARLVNNYQFLTAKPLLIVINIGEEQLEKASDMETEFSNLFKGGSCRVLTLCGKLEMEISQLEESAAEEMRAVYGIGEPGAARVIQASYELSDLITFFTAGPNEVRAWPLKRNTTALKAAGKIHSDMERGFIRAENISLEDLIACGSIAEARKKGLLHLEGKEYIIKDGDVITFLFNV